MQHREFPHGTELSALRLPGRTSPASCSRHNVWSPKKPEFNFSWWWGHHAERKALLKCQIRQALQDLVLIMLVPLCPATKIPLPFILWLKPPWQRDHLTPGPGYFLNFKADTGPFRAFLLCIQWTDISGNVPPGASCGVSRSQREDHPSLQTPKAGV